MKSPLAKALMTTSAKHIWTRTANRREPAKAIFFFNQIVFLIMFLFLPKLLIRHLEDFLLRGKCNKLVRLPASFPCVAVAAAGPARHGGCAAAGVPTSRVVGAASPPGTEQGNQPPAAKRGLRARARAAAAALRRPPPCCTLQYRQQRTAASAPVGPADPPSLSLSPPSLPTSPPFAGRYLRCKCVWQPSIYCVCFPQLSPP